MSGEPDEPMGDYKTGYKRPPKEHQYQKGVSGNSAGRPPKAPALSLYGAGSNTMLTQQGLVDALMLKTSENFVEITIAGKTSKVGFLASSVLQLGRKAAAGSYRETKLFIREVAAAEKRAALAETARIKSIIRYVDGCYRAIARAKGEGRAPPWFDIHPDDIEIDLENGRIDLLCPDDARLRAAIRENGQYFPSIIAFGEKEIKKRPRDKRLANLVQEQRERFDWFERDAARQAEALVAVHSLPATRQTRRHYLSAIQRGEARAV